MTARLMLTCLCDALYGEVGVATVRVLEHCGVRVEFDERQTCCGQPAFNAGDWKAAGPVAERCRQLFAPTTSKDAVYLVTPSGSCAAMCRHGYPMLGLEPLPMMELSEFLIDVLRLERWPLRGNRVARRRQVALHRSCHGRMLGLADQQEQLLRLVPGLDLAPLEQEEQCCGFGGAFSVTHGKISSGIGVEKLRNLLNSCAEAVVSGDMGCLIHLDGLIRRHGLNLKTLHISQVLAEALDS
ncbi:MAG TPA: (Fe-S)-binding protein [Fimbriimonadaceae bacterium]|nr:(Fe-S)-binding protein [Fimbriimonadaceae bacterium]